MKKIVGIIIIASSLVACGNNSNDATKTESSSVTPPVENVEGNIPDSANSINLNKPLPVDSSNLNDSTKQR